MTLPIAIRAGTPSDHPLVYSSWLRSYRADHRGTGGSDFADPLDQQLFNLCHHAVIEALLARSELRIATPKDDPDHICGWALIERIPNATCLHFAYTKGAFRRLGVQHELLADVNRETMLYSHETHSGRTLKNNKAPGATLCPYLMHWPLARVLDIVLSPPSGSLASRRLQSLAGVTP